MKREMRINRISSHGGVRDGEGEIYISYHQYRELAKEALVGSRTDFDARIHHLFLLLSWNLMARSSTVGTLLWNSISWSEDALTIKFEKSKTKTKQEGKDNVAPRHIYANPLQPMICPVLALGVHLCSVSFLESKPHPKVFFCSSPESAFSRWLLNKSAHLYPPGTKKSLIRTQSIRKGAASYATGVTNAPNADAVKLRMGQHSLGLGGSDDHYFYRQAEADQVTGRVVCGLNSASTEIASLPPHFLDNSVIDVESVISPAVSTTASAELKKAFPFLIASVVYHWDFLLANLPQNHPFRTSMIVGIDGKGRWGDSVVCGEFESARSGLKGTGIPKAISLMVENSLLREEQVNLRDRILNELALNPQKTADLVLSRIESAQNIRVLDTNNVVGGNFQRIMTELNAINTKIDACQSLGIIVPAKAAPQHRYNLHPSSGGMCYVPVDFKLPQVDAISFWKLWVFGDVEGQAVTAPYRIIAANTLPRNQQSPFSKAKKVMDLVQTKIGLSYDEIAALGPVLSSQRFIAAFGEIFENTNAKPSHHFATIYKFIEKINN